MKHLMIIESPIEAMLLGALFRVRGRVPFTVSTQVDVEAAGHTYRVDITLTRGESQLAIECDGADWHSVPEKQASDVRRDQDLRAVGWPVLRFPGAAIYRNPGECAERALDELDQLELLPHPRIDLFLRTAPASAAELTDEESGAVGETLQALRRLLSKGRGRP